MRGGRRAHHRVIGVIADTHGLVRREALAALGDSDLIVHAGDVGKPEVLVELGKIAPVVAVRGNSDKGPWASALPETEVVRVGECFLYVLHDVHMLDLDPAAAGFKAVISGHSHRPGVEERAGILYLNPGSAGPRRFNLPVTLARVRIRDRELDAQVIELDV
jgi:hypothetical protein